jgi:nucleoside-diphosphate-sugar epimerase
MQQMTKRYVITGGGGFVGRALGIELRKRGYSVLSLARGEYPELKAHGIESARVDLSSPVEEWRELLVGSSGVFHTAAKVDMWGAYNDFYKTNVLGSRNVVAACRAAGVKNLVFTSSPSVVHSGSDLLGVDEALPYSERCGAHYADTKAIAERETLEASDGGTLRVVALRPHLIWGPGDTNLIPAILERARAGRLTRIGAGQNVVDFTFIDDCVAAHILAMEALEQGRAGVLGKPYFITQGDPVKMWDWIDQVLEIHGLARVSRSVPAALANGIALVLELLARGLNLLGVDYKPLLTRFLVSEMSTHHYFSIAAARRELGYAPSRTTAQALEEYARVAQGA